MAAAQIITRDSPRFIYPWYISPAPGIKAKQNVRIPFFFMATLSHQLVVPALPVFAAKPFKKPPTACWTLSAIPVLWPGRGGVS